MAAKRRHWKEKDGRFWARVSVPVALRPYFLGKTQLAEPLGGDRRVADRRHAAAVARLFEQLESAKRSLGQISLLILDDAACNQQATATDSSVPLAIVNGEDDVFINNNFIAGLTYRNLWENTVHRLPGVGHAPFWEVPDVFDVFLRRFMKDATG